MMDASHNEFSWVDILYWPRSATVLAAIGLTAVLLCLGYWLILREPWQQFIALTQQEMQLRQQLEDKQPLAAYLAAYQQHVRILKSNIDQVAKVFPAGGLPELIEQVAKTASGNGVDIKFIKPLATKKFDFYAILPIQVSLNGNYHSLAKFVSDLINFNKLLTFEIVSLTASSQREEWLNMEGILSAWVTDKVSS